MFVERNNIWKRRNESCVNKLKKKDEYTWMNCLKEKNMSAMNDELSGGWCCLCCGSAPWKRNDSNR